MEVYNNIFCISKPDLTSGDHPILSESNYDQYVYRNPQVRVRKGGGPGCPALLNYELLRSDIKAKIQEVYGDVRKFAQRNRLQELIEPDLTAARYFADFVFDDETEIRPEKQAEYNANAMVLNAIGKLAAERTGKLKRMGMRTTGLWDQISEAVNTLDRVRYPHTLPSNPIRLKDKYQSYREHGPSHLIHRGNKNSNARKVTEKIERLIISLYCMSTLPFGNWVHDSYRQFTGGTLTVIDRETGVMFDREDYMDPDTRDYVSISKSTVWNILKNPSNAILIDRLRNNRIDHVTHTTPFNHRRSPQFSLSKISLDDRTLSRKTSDGKPLNAYLAFDVMSDAVIGCVYSTDAPGTGMVWECFRDMYRTIQEHGLMWPCEAEVENHLMRDIETEIRAMFTYVTFCNPGISRAKRAEHKIRAKKYGDEKVHQEGIGRWYGKGPYKVKTENKDEDYKQPRIPVDRLIAEDRESTHRFNHSLHPNQKMFPGKTRWQVLVENQNPDLSRPQRHKLFRFMGLKTETTLRNNDHCQVRYEKYAIDSLDAISRLKPNNYTVQAYYMPAADGTIDEVFLYQGDTFITKATKIERYNEAKAERTERDEEIRTHQAKRQAHFFKTERDGIREKVTKLEVIRPMEISTDQVEIIPEPEPVEPIGDVEEILARYRTEYTERAISDI